jgi:hypothetical protein
MFIDGVIPMKQTRKTQNQQSTIGRVVCRPSLLISVWLVALVALGNPFACLFHCWYHLHDAATPVTVATQPAAAPAHHGQAHGNNHAQTAIPEQAPTTDNSSSAFTCALIHGTLSALTMAVLLSLLWLVIPFNPGIPLRLPRLSLRLVIFPPPHRPPRFAPFLSS